MPRQLACNLGQVLVPAPVSPVMGYPTSGATLVMEVASRAGIGGATGQSRTRPSRYRRYLASDIAAAVGTGFAAGQPGPLLPGIARREVAESLALAILAAAPFVAGTLGVLAGRLGPHSPLQLAALKVLTSLQLLLILAVSTNGLFLVALVFWIGITFSVPFQVRVWGAAYPPAHRGRLVSVIRTGHAAALAGSSLALGGLSERAGPGVVVVITAIVSACCVAGYAGMGSIPLSREAPYSPIKSFRKVTAHPLIRRLVLAQSILGMGSIAAGSLHALIQVDELGLSLWEIGTIGVAAAGATTTSYLAWGVLADRRGGLVPLCAGAVLSVVGPLAYVSAQGVTWLWVAALATGLAQAAIDLGAMLVITGNVPAQERGMYMAGWAALMGLRGMVAPLVAGLLVQAGVVGARGALVVCGVVTATGALLYLEAALRWRQVAQNTALIDTGDLLPGPAAPRHTT